VFNVNRHIWVGCLLVTGILSDFLNCAAGSASGLVSYTHFPEKTVLLTFDDGPAASTSKVLDTLKEENIKGLFFLVGANITPARKILMQRMIQEGHMLGNHGYHHVNMTRISEKEQTDSLQKTNDCIASVQPKVQYFRPPGGSRNPLLKRSVTTLGMQMMMWNIDPQDWKKDTSGARPNEKTLVKRVLDGLEKSGNKGIVLLHDIHATTANHLPALVRALKAKGFQFLDPKKVKDYQEGHTAAKKE
jgi:peptidoglycan/xylan/chitin deacetylase (PgdA/CDA1 family)